MYIGNWQHHNCDRAYDKKKRSSKPKKVAKTMDKEDGEISQPEEEDPM
jgi:hypothetical protein